MDDHTNTDQHPDPPVTPEVREEIERRTEPERYERERKAARPAAQVLSKLIAKHRRPA